MPSWAEGAQYFQLPRSEHQTLFQALTWANFSGIFQLKAGNKRAVKGAYKPAVSRTRGGEHKGWPILT